MKKLIKLNKKIEINKKNIRSIAILNALDLIDGVNIKNKNNIFDNKLKPIKPLIEIKNLRKEFGVGENKKTVLKNVNLLINQNENLALLGGNGAGKTTLVEILSGLNKPTSGSIKYLFPYKKSFYEEIGIQFQDSSYPPAITVKEVIEFMINIYGCELNSDELNALIKIFAIDEYYRKRASKLSGGQQQRLNVLLALMHNPLIIFLDELSTGLDVYIRTRIKNFINEYTKENNMTIVLVSHDMGEIEQLCKEVAFLKRGEIIYKNSISIILKEYKTLENFVEKMLIEN